MITAIVLKTSERECIPSAIVAALCPMMPNSTFTKDKIIFTTIVKLETSLPIFNLSSFFIFSPRY